MPRKMKDSGIPWVGQIPEDWEVTRLKNIVNRKIPQYAPNEELLSVFLDRGVIRFIDGGTKRANVASADLSKYQLVEPGDFVLNNQQAWRGSVGVSVYRGIISPAYLILKLQDEINTKFANYLFRSKCLVSLYEQCSHGVGSIQRNIYWEELRVNKIPLPHLPEQRRIADYLDKTVGRIDGLREKISREIERLGDYKKSVISEAVCRGLDKTAKMKDSGVFWQPQMPEGWRVTRLKYVLKKKVRYAEKNSDLLICTNKGKVTKRGDSSIGLIAKDDSIYQGVKKGDLLIHGMDTWHGAIAVSEYDGMCTPVVHVCESNEDKAFISYYLRNMAREKIFKLISNSVRENSSDLRSWEKVGEIKIILPPKDEQLKVSQYLLNQEKKIDALIGKRKAELERLEALKRSIICECVTGRREVA